MAKAPVQPAAIGILTSRIGRRFVTLFTGCALLPLVAFAWLAVSRATNQMGAELQASLHNGAKTAGMGIAARLSQVAGDLSLAREFMQRWGQAGHGGAMTLQQHVGVRCAAVWAVDQGKVLELSGSVPSALAPLEPRELRHLAAGRPVVRSVGEPAQLFMIAAVDPADAAAAQVVAHIRPEWFWDPDELRMAGCEFGAFDSHWRPLFLTFRSAPDTTPLAAAAAQQKSSGTVDWFADGQPGVARYWHAFLRPQYHFDLFVVQSRDQREARAVADGFAWWFLLTASCTLLLVLFVSLVQMRRTLGPIVSLRDATREVAAGELGARVSIKSDDEFGELGAAFNHMTAQLQENIRRREQTERELVASRDAALAAAHAKATFVTNVSHELRTPMTELLSATEILCSVSDIGPEEREEFAAIALQGAQRLARLVDDVLELGSAGFLAMEPLDLKESIEAAIAKMPKAVRKRVKLQLESAPAGIIGNAQRLVDTWRRLLDNAAKFSAPNSPIEVRVRRTGNELMIEIADQGVGISRPDLAKLFEPFCQVGRDQMLDKARGTGLGLSLAKNAIDLHAGRIEVDSELGSGTTFRVFLPAYDAVPSAVVG